MSVTVQFRPITDSLFSKFASISKYVGKVWKIDPIHNGIGDDLLMYRGEVSGQYIQVYERDGKSSVTFGSYDYAYPHIGEASFTPVAESVFTSFQEAMDFVKKMMWQEKSR